MHNITQLTLLHLLSPHSTPSKQDPTQTPACSEHHEAHASLLSNPLPCKLPDIFTHNCAGDLQWQLYDLMGHRNEWWVPGKLVELRQRLEPYWRVSHQSHASVASHSAAVLPHPHNRLCHVHLWPHLDAQSSLENRKRKTCLCYLCCWLCCAIICNSMCPSRLTTQGNKNRTAHDTL